MNRSIVIAVLLLSPLSIILENQTSAFAVLVSSTTTQTVTSYVTLTGTGETTQYQTFTQFSSVETTTKTTHTTTGVVMVPIQQLSTVIYPVATTLYAMGVGCACCPQVCSTNTISSVSMIYVTETGWVEAYSPSTKEGEVTKRYATSVPTTVYSTTTSTSTYATGQVVGITATQTFTSVSEQAGPSISDMLSQNLWIILVLFAVVLGVLGFRFGRRGGTGPSGVSPPTAPAQSVQGPKPGIVYCRNCGTQNPATNEFCGKCGTKL